jgi:hypothetical protein
MHGIPRDELAMQQREAIEGISLRRVIASLPRDYRERIVMLLHDLNDQIDAQGEYLAHAEKVLIDKGFMVFVDHSPSTVSQPTYAGSMIQSAINSNKRMVNLMEFSGELE